ncbi:MAG: O-antigen ligase family protein [Chloroflexi bacterium]|nr:O-antigen ligase family protein [Chloroflexota bacterium]
MSLGQSLRARLATYVDTAGPLILLGAAPAIWFAGPPGGLALAILPLLLVVRRILRLPVGLHGTDGLVLACALWIAVTALAVSDWNAAAPKLFGALLGLSLVYVIGAYPIPAARLRIQWLGLAVGITVPVVLAALFLTEWPQRKLLPLDGIYAMLPAGPRVVDHGGRIGGIGPNQIGGALALVAPLGLALSLDETGSNKNIRRLAAVTVALAITVLLLTQSRSAFVGALLGLTLVGWWRISRSAWLRRPLGRTALHVALGLSLALLMAAVASTWLAPLDSTTDTLTGRLQIWTASVLLIGEYLYTGVGPGQFPLVLKAAFPQVGASVAPHIPHAHSFVLQALLDLGLPGSLLLGILIALALRGLILTARDSGDTSLQLLAVGLGGSLLAFFVYGLTDTIAPGARGGLPFWLVLGLALACGRLARHVRLAE